jgi:Cu(I)/Ag(I) efflux system membrane fusion protein
MKPSLFALMMGATLLTANLQAQHAHSDSGKGKSHPVKSGVSLAFQKQFGSVLAAYTDLKNALVASDATRVKTAVQPVRDALRKVDMKLLKGETHTQWMTQFKNLNSHLDMIAKAGSVEDQRKHFAALSETMHHSIQSFGTGGKEAYYQYCPMAMGHQGAYWLSEAKEIKNPYFGDKMLRCGETKEVLN